MSPEAPDFNITDMVDVKLRRKFVRVHRIWNRYLFESVVTFDRDAAVSELLDGAVVEVKQLLQDAGWKSRSDVARAEAAAYNAGAEAARKGGAIGDSPAPPSATP